MIIMKAMHIMDTFSPYRNYDSLVYTMDGGGDNTNGTVSIGKAGEHLNEISDLQIVISEECIDMPLFWV